MSFLDYYNTEAEPLEERLGTGEHLAKDVDRLRQWLIKDKDKDKKNVGVQRKIPKLDKPTGRRAVGALDQDTVKGVDGVNGRDGAEGEEGRDAKQPEGTPSDGPRLSEFGGRGNRGWWYLFADPKTIDILDEVLNSEKFADTIEKKVKLGRNNFLTGYRYIMKPLEGEEHKPNKYRSIYLVKDKVNPRTEDRYPDFGFVIFDGKESFDQANKLFLKGMIDDLYGDPETASKLLKFSQPKPTDVAANPVFYNSFKNIPTENLPDEHVRAIEDLLKELKDELDADTLAGAEHPTESFTFSSMYEVGEDFELIPEASGYLINDLLASVGGKLFRGMGQGMAMGLRMLKNRKPKKIKVTRFQKHMLPNKTYNISYQGYVATNTGCAQSMMEYKNYVAKKGKMWARAAGMQTTFIVERYEPVLRINDQEFIKMFGFKPIVDITEITMWKTSNGGWVTSMSLLEGLKAPSGEGEETYSGPEKIEQDERDDLKFYVGCDTKGEKYFIDTFGMSLKQYLQSKKTASGATLKKQSEIIHASMSNIKDIGGSNYVIKYTKDQHYKTVKKNVINWAMENQGMIQKRLTKDYTKGIDPDKSEGIGLTLKNGGEISVYKDKNPGKRTYSYVIKVSPKAYDMFKGQGLDPEGMKDYKKAGEE